MSQRTSFTSLAAPPADCNRLRRAPLRLRLGLPFGFGAVRREHVLATAAASSLVLLAIGVFAPVVRFGFVNWDDPWYVLNNPLIESWRPANLWAIATTSAVRNYAPLTMLGLLVQHSLWGLWPGGYHLVNVLLHAVNVVLVIVLVQQLTRSRSVAWITAALFAVHPVQVETVAWISSFKGLLSGTFILASLICWLRPAPTPRNEGWGMLCHALGLASKALGITVPFIVLTYDVVVLRKRLGAAVARQVIPMLLAVVVLLITMSAQSADLGGMRGHLQWSKAHVAAVDGVVLWKYVGMLAWPSGLCVLYDPATAGLDSGNVTVAMILAAVGWAAVAGMAVLVRKRQPLFVLALATFFALLFPVLNFFPITTLLNDRYLYLSSIPVFATFAAALLWIANRVAARDGESGDRLRIRRRLPAVVAAGVLVLGFAASTRERLNVWRDDRSLWRDAIQKSAGLAVVRIQWADSLHQANDDRQAVAVLEQALRETNPDAADRTRILRRIGEWSAAPGSSR